MKKEGGLVTQALSGGTWFNKQVYWLTFRARSAHLPRAALFEYEQLGSDCYRLLAD